MLTEEGAAERVGVVMALTVESTVVEFKLEFDRFSWREGTLALFTILTGFFALEDGGDEDAD